MTFEQKRDQLEGEIRSLEENLALYTAMFSQYQKLGADDPGFAETQKKLRQKKTELASLNTRAQSGWYHFWCTSQDLLPLLWIGVISISAAVFADITLFSFSIFKEMLLLVALLDVFMLIWAVWATKTPF